MLIIEWFNFLRVNQWTKNIFIFAPIFFIGELFDINHFFQVLQGFFLFCLVASAGYILNDIVDIESDRQHPYKKYRPIAAEKISAKKAAIILLIIVSLAIPYAFLFSREFGEILLLYALLSLSYSIFLKKFLFINMSIVASFFVLRAYAGTIILNVPISGYLIILTFFLALFVIVGKRFRDGLLLKMHPNRKIFEFSLLILVIIIVFFYGFYIYHIYSIKHVKPLSSLILSLLFVILGLSRFLVLIFSPRYLEASFDSVISDRFIVLSAFLWILALFIPFYLHALF